VNENSPLKETMKNQKKNSYTIFGINNAISILETEKLQVSKVDILKKGRAEKDNQLLYLISKLNFQPKFYDKQGFFQKYPDGRTQGIAIVITDEVVKDRLPEFSESESVCLLALDQIEDPQNFGQIIRTAECAGIDGIIFSKHHSSPITDTVLQVSQGAFVSMPLYEVTNLKNEFNQLKEDGFWIIGLENSIDAKAWHEIDYKGKTVIVVGSEGKGIREKVLETCDFKATIPMQGETNSLNVSAAVSAIVFERLRQIQESK
jgi:23S rRNA (guanosine2251-2'-O)-methyltransferase